ncbi:MAG: dethiobiotin synthase [Chromatiales bacterium]|nr:MAG: dethiobiotin synthase [Chromatiales bacterium]
MSQRAYFITGTDTGVGKTLVGAALLHAANAQGWSTIGLKPVAAGGTHHDGVFMNEDACLLQATASIELDYAAVNPAALADAIAPHIAAERDGRTLNAAELATHCRHQLATSGAEFAVAEGAGGWLVPLDARTTMADLATSLGWPVILVVAMRLGCLNHALLTARAIEAAGLALAGWVANVTGEQMAAEAANLATLDNWLPAPRLGCIRQLGPDPQPADAAGYLDLSLLPELAG